MLAHVDAIDADIADLCTRIEAQMAPFARQVAALVLHETLYVTPPVVST